MATKKDYEDAPHIGSGRVGLTVMRMQPPHRGHIELINLMRADCDVAIVAFGSTQQSRVMRHPFSFEQRLEMVRATFGLSIKPLPLVDIDSNLSIEDWSGYVLDKVRKLNLPAPTDYYTSSTHDAKWYAGHFAKLSDPVIDLGLVKTYTSPSAGRRLHVYDRTALEIPPAEEIRSLIERRDPEWRNFIPARLVDYIEWNYPPELRMPLRGETLPDPASVPAGTLFTLAAPQKAPITYCLHGENGWLPHQG